MSSKPGPDRAAGLDRRLLWCSACRRAVECTLNDLLRYSREGWPRCCHQVMAFFTEDGGPPAGPAADRPRPAPPGK